MDYMVFNGVSSQDLGIIIEQLPDEHRPKRAIEQTQIPGRHGRITEDLGAYDQYNTNCKVNCNGRAPTDIYAWLQGEGWLTTSQDARFMRWVSFYDLMTDDRFRIGGSAEGCFDTLSIPMVVQPYKYLVQQDEIELTEAGVFPGQGNEYSAPIIAVTGTGSIDLMVNNATLLLDEINGTIYIDCDAMTAYTEENGIKTFAGRKVTVMDDTWAYLKPGSNTINWSGNVNRVKIQPWWRWI